MPQTPTITSAQVAHIAQLANVAVSAHAAEDFAKAFTETLAVVDTLKQLETASVEPTHQVTGLENVLREDEVDEDSMFSQDEALANAPATHSGFFVVPRILED